MRHEHGNEDEVAEEVVPDDGIAQPKDVLVALHGVVKLFNRSEVDLLPFELVEFIEDRACAAKSVKISHESVERRAWRELAIVAQKVQPAKSQPGHSPVIGSVRRCWKYNDREKRQKPWLMGRRCDECRKQSF